MLGRRFDEAVAYASIVHADHVRKGSGKAGPPVPYIAHLLGVAALVLEDGGGEDEAIAALLHDSVEDRGGQPRLDDIRHRFGDRVASIVRAASDAVPERGAARRRTGGRANARISTIWRAYRGRSGRAAPAGDDGRQAVQPPGDRARCAVGRARVLGRLLARSGQPALVLPVAWSRSSGCDAPRARCCPSSRICSCSSSGFCLSRSAPDRRALRVEHGPPPGRLNVPGRRSGVSSRIAVPDEPEQPESGAHHASVDAVRHRVHAAEAEAQALARRSEEAAAQAMRTAAPRDAGAALAGGDRRCDRDPDSRPCCPTSSRSVRHSPSPSSRRSCSLVLMIVAPQRRPDEPAWHRTLAIGMIAVVNAANIASLGFLISLLFTTHFSSGTRLMLSAALIWVTNVIAFSLWYWELDGGGPHKRIVARAEGGRGSDFLFPQMTTGDPADAGWKPEFLDYVFVSFTTATAFSPTDTMPLSSWAKCPDDDRVAGLADDHRPARRPRGQPHPVARAGLAADAGRLQADVHDRAVDDDLLGRDLELEAALGAQAGPGEQHQDVDREHDQVGDVDGHEHGRPPISQLQRQHGRG